MHVEYIATSWQSGTTFSFSDACLVMGGLPFKRGNFFQVKCRSRTEVLETTVFALCGCRPIANTHHHSLRKHGWWTTGV